MGWWTRGGPGQAQQGGGFCLAARQRQCLVLVIMRAAAKQQKQLRPTRKGAFGLYHRPAAPRTLRATRLAKKSSCSDMGSTSGPRVVMLALRA